MSRLSRFIHFYTDEDDGNGGTWERITGAVVQFFTKIIAPIKLVASLDPIQDLHGQDAPYPPGGGRNILPMTVDGIKADNTSGEWSGNAYTLNGVTFTIQTNDTGAVTGVNVSGQASANTAFNIVKTYDLGRSTDGLYISGCPSDGSSTTYRIRASNGTTKNEYGSGAQFGEGGSTIDFYIQILSGYNASNLLFKPMLSVSSDLTFAPYSNLCPIIGHTGVTVYLDDEVYPFDQGGLNDSSGTESNTANRIRTGYIPIPTSDTITIGLATGQESDDIIRRIYYYSGKSTDTFISSESLDGSTRIPPYTYTMTKPTGAVYFRIVLQKNPPTNPISPTGKVLYISPTTIPISWQTEAGTVYYGTLVIHENGSVTLTATHGENTVGNLSWEYDTTSIQNTPVFKTNISGRELGSTDFICSAYKNTGGTRTTLAGTNGCMASWNLTSSITIAFTNSMYTDATAFKTAMASVQIVYKLATPLTYTLDSIDQLYTKLGTNNIWVDDSDEISVTYRQS